MLVSLAEKGCEGCLKDGHGHYEVFLLWGKRDDAKEIVLNCYFFGLLKITYYVLLFYHHCMVTYILTSASSGFRWYPCWCYLILHGNIPWVFQGKRSLGSPSKTLNNESGGSLWHTHEACPSPMVVSLEDFKRGDQWQIVVSFSFPCRIQR